MGVLTTVGVLEGGKITDKIRDKFIEDVKFLVGNGNSKDFWFVPIGPEFGPDPMMAPLNLLGLPLPPYEDKEQFPIFHKIFIDTMLEGTAKMFDVEGSTPFFPVADPCSFALQLDLPLPNLDLDVALSIFPIPSPPKILELLDIDPLDFPDILAKLPGIKIPGVPSPPSIPSIPIPSAFIPIPTLPIPNFDLKIPLPSLPPIPFPKFPKIPDFDFSINIPGLFGILGCIFKHLPLIFIQVIAKFPELTAALAEGPLGIIKFFAGVVLAVILSCLEEFGLVLGTITTFIAGLVVYIKHVVIFSILALIASLLGNGCITLGMAAFLLN